MKKIYIAMLALGAILLSSCVQEKNFKDITVGENEIAFVMQGVSTRSAVEGTSYAVKGITIPMGVIEGESLYLEETIEELGNTKDRQIISYLNQYPIVATHAHTRPFRQKWLNIITGLILPLGLFFYLRMCRFRLRLRKDLNKITETSELVVNRIAQVTPQ